MRTLDIPIEKFIPTAPRVVKRLHALGIKTARDLLYHIPRRYDDFSSVKKVSELRMGETATIQGTIKKIAGRRAWGRRMFIIEAEIEDDTGAVPITWFNQHHLLKTLKAGALVSISGKVGRGKKGLYFQHPAYEIIESRIPVPEQARYGASMNQEASSKFMIHDSGFMNLRHTGRLVPVYPETRGLTSRWLRFLMQTALSKLPQKLPEFIPDEILKREKFSPLQDNLQKVHFPRSFEEAERAKRRFRFEELLLLQLKKHQVINERRVKQAPIILNNANYLEMLVGRLPFALTGDQQKALDAVLSDITRATPMNRLLDGDVGSGKTIVAALAGMLAIKQGFQVLFMAPTEILAHQHFETILKFFGTDDIGIALITASRQKLISPYGSFSKKSEILPFIKNGTAEFIIGTHALLQGSAEFKNIGLIVIDEQHRFGVAQRAALMNKNRESGIMKHESRITHHEARIMDQKSSTPNAHSVLPHLLSMTATPIPRTLALTVYGDLDISIIKEMPVGRKKIITKIVRPVRRAAAYRFIENEMKKGRQVFVICPLIENADEKPGSTAEWLAEEVKSVKREFEKLSKEIFPHRKIAMLHGKLKPKEKEATMRAFTDSEYDLLVSTSVVEVGVDVPNATVMMVEGAERFGLASLHQFRGRVGRGEHQSYCLLFPSSETHEWNERLKAVALSHDGFSLAEKDLKLRGPGNLVGLEQSGFHAPLQQALSDVELVEKTSEYAKKIISDDPELKKYPLLKERLGAVRYILHAD